jgi:hypothetical protein
MQDSDAEALLPQSAQKPVGEDRMADFSAPPTWLQEM